MRPRTGQPGARERASRRFPDGTRASDCGTAERPDPSVSAEFPKNAPVSPEGGSRAVRERGGGEKPGGPSGRGGGKGVSRRSRQGWANVPGSITTARWHPLRREVWLSYMLPCAPLCFCRPDKAIPQRCGTVALQLPPRLEFGPLEQLQEPAPRSHDSSILPELLLGRSCGGIGRWVRVWLTRGGLGVGGWVVVWLHDGGTPGGWCVFPECNQTE